MASLPPSYKTAASVSRSKMTDSDLKSKADEMLRQSLSRPRNVGPNAPTSMSSAPAYRSQISPNATSNAGEQLQRSLSQVRGIQAVAQTSPVPPVNVASRANSARLRVQQLEHDVQRKNAQTPPRNSTGMFKAACSTDVLFLLDTTNSMKPYIDAAKQQVRDMVVGIKEEFLNQAEVRVAIVSYKDHQCNPNIQFLDFTSSTDEVYLFLDGLIPAWGRDFAEDVLGGVQKAVNASWQQQMRWVFHIGDAPPHGRTLHDMSDNESNDEYYNTGSEPHGLTHEPLLKQLVEKNVNYAMLRIRHHTDRMVLEFSRLYGHLNAKLHKSNRYYEKTSIIGHNHASKNGKQKRLMGPQFEELHLGVSYSDIKKLVIRTVTSSLSQTAGRVTSAWTEESKAAWNELAQNQTTICSDGIVLETAPPQWDEPGWLSKKLDVEGFCPAPVEHSGSTLNEMMAANENIKISSVEFTIYTRPKPFGQGQLRRASYARTEFSNSHFVAKSFIKHNHSQAEMAEDMRIQTLCKAFALEFNGLLKIEPPLDFVITSCLQHKPKIGLNDYLWLEPYIDGDYVKYNNNTSYVNTDLPDDSFNQLAQAFSHFTFERSWGQLLINDLQGVGHVLTDPSIQTKDPEKFKLCATNFNEEGFKFFFATHECNPVCQELGLKSNRWMLAEGNLEFREMWPRMEPTVCCSHKLCRRIIRQADSNVSEAFPDYHWCGACWSQLEASMVSWICIEPRCEEIFTASRFFYESQGQYPPRKCLEHRVKDAAESTASIIGASLWNSMKPRETGGQIHGKHH